MKIVDAKVPLSALDVTDVGAIEAGQVCECFLRYALLHPAGSYPGTDLDTLREERGRRLQPFDLRHVPDVGVSVTLKPRTLCSIYSVVPEGPKALADPALLSDRLLRVPTEPRVAELNRWVAALRVETKTPVPWFDPSDGGAESRVLFLLETPGRMADAAIGSGIVSIDNNDDTARNLWEFRREAGLTGLECVHWNAVPEFISGKAPTASEVKDGSRRITEVLELLPSIQVVVLMGAHAQKAWAQHCLRQRTHITAISTWHPSKLGLAGPDRRDQVETAVRVAASVVSDSNPPEPLGPRHSEGSPGRTGALREGLTRMRQRSSKRVEAVRVGLRR